MNPFQFEILKCDKCGKTLGYMHVSVRIFPPEEWIRLVAGGPKKEIEKIVFCEECSQRGKKKPS